MEVEIRRSKYVSVCDTLSVEGDRLEGDVHTLHGAVMVYGRNGWVRLRLTIDGREYRATFDAPVPQYADRLRRLAGRFARTVATLAAGSPDGKGPYTVTLAR